MTCRVKDVHGSLAERNEIGAGADRLSERTSCDSNNKNWGEISACNYRKRKSLASNAKQDVSSGKT